MISLEEISQELKSFGWKKDYLYWCDPITDEYHDIESAYKIQEDRKNWCWWGEYSIGKSIFREYRVATGKITFSTSKPYGQWWGPFHCQKCANDCCNFGATQNKAWKGNHGTSDEQFCAWLGGC